MIRLINLVNWMWSQVAKILGVELFRVSTVDDKLRFEWLPQFKPQPGLDERIAKIDEARQNLTAALSAIDELKTAANENRDELRRILDNVERVRADKQLAETELQHLQRIASADIEVLRKITGVPSRRRVALERLIGFILGVAASLVAAWISSKIGRH